MSNGDDDDEMVPREPPDDWTPRAYLRLLKKHPLIDDPGPILHTRCDDLLIALAERAGDG